MAVAAVTDGRTLALADGRTVRLAMIEVPPVPPSGSAPPDQTQAGNRSRRALRALVEGQQLLLTPFGADRFGRVLARAYLPESPKPKAVEVALLTTGFAFVSPYAGNHNCAADLFAAERAARVAKLGLWGMPNLQPGMLTTPTRCSRREAVSQLLRERSCRCAKAAARFTSTSDGGGTRISPLQYRSAMSVFFPKVD
jgi:endonuclease YncB( thermonuclease family)